MSVYNDVLAAVQGLAAQAAPGELLIIGSMPPDNGISIAWAGGYLNTFVDKRAAVEMSAVLNAKNTGQEKAAALLSDIHTSLNMRKEYPAAENFQITNIETSSAPSYLGREENEQWLYGSSLTVKFYLKGA